MLPTATLAVMIGNSLDANVAAPDIMAEANVYAILTVSGCLLSVGYFMLQAYSAHCNKKVELERINADVEIEDMKAEVEIQRRRAELQINAIDVYIEAYRNRNS